MPFIWKSTEKGSLPPNAVYVGQDLSGELMYVGRVNHGGQYLPAKMFPLDGFAAYSYNGEEMNTRNCEMLCGEGFSWTQCNNGRIPKNAVNVNDLESGEATYIGRGLCQGALTCGRIDPLEQCLYIPFGNGEVTLRYFEVLVYTSPWMSCLHHQTLPSRGVVAGHDSDGQLLYVGRARYCEEIIPGKVHGNICSVSSNGKEIIMEEYEVLTGTEYIWVSSSFGHVPSNALVAGETATGESLLIGRARHNGSLIPGKVLPSEQSLFIVYNGNEIECSDYEILVKTSRF